MTRRLIAATAVASALCGLGAAFAPAHAGNNGGRLCIGTTDDRRPGYMQGICLDEPLPRL
ncbi:MAG TPA: hypothetical protein VFQ85_16580 [Mycobacteriales bacterium]|jgi:hypothetical protein|nr:hypothetical protein [Mycobacteriales bacterium]